MKPRRATLLAARLRRIVQIGVVGFLVYAAAGGIWRNYKVAHNSARLVGLMEGDAWGLAYATNESALRLVDEDTVAASLNFLGLTWSATFFGIETADPILVLAHAVANFDFTLRLWLGGIVALSIAVVLGKVFCSYICPMRLIFDIGQLLRAGLLWFDIPLPRIRMGPRLGGWILLGGLIGSVGSGVGIWFFLLPYLSLAASIFIMVTTGVVSGLIAVVSGWALVDAFVAPGLFCHNFCPQGFLLEQFGPRQWKVLGRDHAAILTG